ncbi:MAG TPA: hypothetical protein VGL94_08985 [Ktedonobacteraceae bacterium]
MDSEKGDVQNASQEAIFATPVLKSAIEQVHQASWRTEPEIDLARQEELACCLGA